MSQIKNLVTLLTTLAGVKGTSFVSIKGYVSKKSNNTELQDVLININVPYGAAKEKDIEFLKNVTAKEFQAETGTSLNLNLLEEARTALLGALISPSKARSQSQTDAYEKVNDWLKVHKTDGTVFIFGMKVRKTVKVKGDFSKDTRKPLTIAKDLFRSKMKHTQYRQYIVSDSLSRLDSIKGNGDTIEF